MLQRPSLRQRRTGTPVNDNEDLEMDENPDSVGSHITPKDPKASTLGSSFKFIFISLCFSNASIAIASDIAQKDGVSAGSVYFVTAMICVIALIPWIGVRPMMSEIFDFDIRTHAMLILCRVLYMLNNIPNLRITQNLGGVFYQLTKLVNLLPILVGYTIIGTHSGPLKWLTACTIVLFAFLYADIDHVISGGDSLNYRNGFLWVGIKISARTCYTILQELTLKETLSSRLSEVSKIQILSLYDAVVCLIYTMTADYSKISASSSLLLTGWNISTCLVPLAEALYSCMSLKVLSVATGEWLPLSQGFALVIVYISHLTMGNEDVTYNKVLAVTGMAVGNYLFCFVSRKDEDSKINDSSDQKLPHPKLPDEQSQPEPSIPSGMTSPLLRRTPESHKVEPAQFDPLFGA